MVKGPAFCRACNIGLIGSKKNEIRELGRFACLITVDSSDCNWRRCNTCKDTLCYTCYHMQSTYCCEGDYIAHRERAQLLADRQEFETKNNTEETMNEFKIVYLIVEKGIEANRQTFWRTAGSAYVCRDGSLNVRLDIHPGLTFNIRDPKSNGERIEASSGVEQSNGEVEEFPTLKAVA